MTRLHLRYGISSHLLLTCLFSLRLVNPALGQTQEQKQALKQAIQCYEQGKLSESKELLLGLTKTNHLPPEFSIQVWNNLGNVYADQGKNLFAIEAYNKALYQAKQRSKKEEESKLLKNIGAVYMSLGRFNKAETYYEEALQMALAMKNTKIIADCYNNLGTVYEQTARIELAKDTYFKAIELYKRIRSYTDIAMVSSNLAIVYKSDKRLDSCIHYNQVALKASVLSKDLWMQSAISNNLGNVYGEYGQLDSAVSYLTNSLNLAREIDALEIEIMALESLSDAYHRAGKDYEAFSYLKKMQKQQQLFNNLSLNKSIDELNIRYQTKEQKMRNIELQNKQRYILLFSVIGCLIFALVVGFIWYAKRKKMREYYLKEVNAVMIESESNARMELASDLHDHIGQKIAVISMSTHHVEGKTKQNIQDLLADLGNEVRSLSHRLVPEAFRFGLVRALKELKEELNQSTNVQLHIHTADNAFEEFSATNNLSIYRILQELVSNALKHAKASEIEIAIEKTAGSYAIAIRDNGKGFNTSQLKKSSGIGWKTIASRIDALGGTWSVSSSSKGTEIQLHLPLPNEK